MKNLLLVSSILLMLPHPTFADWRSEADARIDKLRKGDFFIEVHGADGKVVPDATIEFHLKRHDFLFGTAVAYKALVDESAFGRTYRQFILDHFSGVVCENEMKWYADEPTRGAEDYAQADAIVAFAEKNHLQMRGHCLVWAKQQFVQDWVQALGNDDVHAALQHRIDSVVTRYAGRLVSWDVNNEMLDGTYFSGRLGSDVNAWTFTEAAKIDPKTPLFVNEYGIFGNPDKTDRYIAMIHDLQSKGAKIDGIGIQAHDTNRLTDSPETVKPTGNTEDWLLKDPLTPERFLATLDHLHSETKLPIHITEVSSRSPDVKRRADSLEMLFRLGFSHEAVHAIVLWGFDAKNHWMGPDAALMNADGSLNAAGERIGYLLRKEWWSRGLAESGKAGRAHIRGFFGTYMLKIRLPNGAYAERDVHLSKEEPNAIVTIVAEDAVSGK